MTTQAKAAKKGAWMRATETHSTLLIPQFPVALRLRVKAKALLERRPMREVFAEVVEKGLAAMDVEKVGKRGKR